MFHHRNAIRNRAKQKTKIASYALIFDDRISIVRIPVIFAYRLVRRILAGHDLLVVNDLTHAKKAVECGGLSLVFVGARFDDSRMFDLIELVRNELEQKKIPIVAAIITPTTLGKEAVAGLSHAVKIFGASLFINLNDFPDNVVGNARARVIVDTMILPPEAVTRIAPAPLRPPT